MEGRCNCSRVRVTIPASNEITAATCHCINCHRAGASVCTALDDKDVTIEGELKEYVDKDTDSGTPVSRWFCPNCGSPVMSTSPMFAGKKIMKFTLFTEFPQSKVEVFTEHRQPWMDAIPGAMQFERNVPGK